MRTKPISRPRLAFLAVLLLLFTAKPLFPFGFGHNKVRYHTGHHWKVIETPHFLVHYYEPCEELGKTAARDAEKAFQGTCQAFDFVPKNRIPLYIYATPLEFEETNITPQVLEEGVGGFTEVFKNRIAVPMDGSYHEFEKVLHHELTHAFQYDLIYGEGWRSVNLFKAVFVPTWMMEGMAEWNAQHLDAQGEMVLRDAILNDKIIPLNLMDSFEHFPQVYTAYKESQSILDYIDQIYGYDKVGQLFKRMAANQPPDAACKALLGIGLMDLYDQWRFYLRSKIWSRIEGMAAPERYGEKWGDGISRAAVSPDGRSLAFLRQDDLVLWTLPDKKEETLHHAHFDPKGNGLAWSPDGKNLAFCATENGEYRLETLEIASHKLTVHRIDGFPVLFSPVWTPDGGSIVLAGFDYQTVDLLRYDLSSRKATRWTDDQATENSPCLSPDGKTLFYIQEDEGRCRILSSPVDPQMGPGAAQVVAEGIGQVTGLHWAQGALYLTSNLNKAIFNLFRLEPATGTLTQLTDSFVDILNAVPAPDAGNFYAVLYQKGALGLYAFDAKALENTPAPPGSSGYLCNDFRDSLKVFPKPAVIVEKGSDTLNQDRDQPEIEPTRTVPTQPPLPPTHLDVTEATNIVQVQWAPGAGEGENIDSFRIYRSSVEKGPFSPVTTLTHVHQRHFVDYDVENGQTYFYYVTALNGVGESGPSPVVEAHPSFAETTQEDGFAFTPDILLFLAGYDSSFGFVGGGVVQMSDNLGDHRLGLLGDTIPGVRTGLEANYEFAQWRTTVDLDLYYYQNYFNIYDLQTGSIVNQYRNNENGFALNFTYPLTQDTRFEYGFGTQRFLGSPVYLQFSEGISNYAPADADKWDVANYYRLSFVQDKRTASNFWPSGGYALDLTLLHAPPILDSTVSFANVMTEAQWYVDFGFLNHLVWANRLIGMTSQGRDPQQFFIGNDAPFQAFFTTIRGYGGPTFFGSNLALYNTELRYPLATDMDFIPQPLSFLLIKDLELAGFLDLGAVADQIQQIPDSHLLASAGTGLRIYTFAYQRALILLRFDVAWRLDETAPPSFHFNLVPMF
ncbi:MAG TPA: BamA/TamA family outer membrane protein [bacterium]|nr:BamA/TamA family outer membrane protein [bacterium]